MYGRGIYALRDVTLSIEKGEFVFLTGSSGAGKSTFLRLLLRQEIPTEGRVTVAGRDLAGLSLRQVQTYRRTVGFVFQDFKLIPSRTVLDNVALVPRVLGETSVQQQRIAIARALVNEPALVLADEPTGNLDPDLSLEIMNLFRDINARGTTVVVATHVRELIRRVGRRSITLEHGRLTGAA